MTTTTVDTTQTLRVALPRFLDLLAADARDAIAQRAAATAQLERYPGPSVLDAHARDLVLALTAITPGRRYFTCARFGHSIDPRDFVHTTGPCPDDQTPSTTLPASSESDA